MSLKTDLDRARLIPIHYSILSPQYSLVQLTLISFHWRSQFDGARDAFPGWSAVGSGFGRIEHSTAGGCHGATSSRCDRNQCLVAITQIDLPVIVI